MEMRLVAARGAAEEAQQANLGLLVQGLRGLGSLGLKA